MGVHSRGAAAAPPTSGRFRSRQKRVDRVGQSTIELLEDHSRSLLGELAAGDRAYWQIGDV
jgi:hypothetical protein